MTDETFTPQSPHERRRRRSEGCARWVPAVPEGAASARGHARNALRHWGMDEYQRERAALLIGELVENAIHHGARHRGRPLRMVWCHIQRTRDTVRLSVWGLPGTSVPRPRCAPDGTGGSLGTLRETGRGLLLVAAMSRACGTHVDRANRQVWAEL
ncbi:ATP-binding protein [Streptomyces sp. 796.1]|uniref:ATP-binding protein n=1 Tax=Streptomyces sp. 796.1 TaxID=3163029 RepID=UPI0039C8F6C4